MERETMAENLRSVTDADFETEVIAASKSGPVMVDFWADWCRPCHMLAPTVEEIARQYAGKLKVVKMNVDENINAPGRFQIRGIPTLLLFRDGQVADQIVGAVPKEQIDKVLARHLS
jgi:thioredoxin 1